MHTDVERRSRSFLWWRTPGTGVGPKARRQRAMSHVFVWAATLRILLAWTREEGTRDRLALIAFRRPLNTEESRCRRRRSGTRGRVFLGVQRPRRREAPRFLNTEESRCRRRRSGTRGRVFLGVQRPRRCEVSRSLNTEESRCRRRRSGTRGRASQTATPRNVGRRCWRRRRRRSGTRGRASQTATSRKVGRRCWRRRRSGTRERVFLGVQRQRRREVSPSLNTEESRCRRRRSGTRRRAPR